MTKWEDKFRLNFLSGKRLLWTNKIRIFCDGGYPLMLWFPRLGRFTYNEYWKMHGFVIRWLGREFFFSFGKDVNHLYLSAAASASDGPGGSRKK